MIQSYPSPRDEESFYSLNAKYFYNLRGVPIGKLYLEIFGERNVKASVDFATHLRSYCRALSHLLNFTPIDVIDKLTLFPFYRAFLVKSKVGAIVKAMIDGNADTIHTRIGINASLTRRSRYPKYCPICANNDIELNNETYWRLSHQIPDANVCVSHRCFLLTYKPNLNKLSKLIFLYPNRNQLEFSSIQYPKTDINLKISQFFLDIHKGRRIFSIEDTNYLTSLEQYGLCEGTKVYTKRLITAFRDYYSDEALNEILPEKIKGLKWLRDIVKRPIHYFHPLRHALLNIFIESCSKISISEKNVFGPGPWMCYNKASEHFLTKVVTDLKCYHDKKADRVIGILRCDCGMTYTKSFIKQISGTNKEFIRIKNRGKIWEEKLDSILTKGFSLREIARQLGTDAKTIKLYINVNADHTDKCGDLGNELVEYQKRWLKLLSNYPQNKILQARRAEPKIYAWLYRNAREWLLLTNQSNVVRSTTTQLRLDWEELDKELNTKVIDAINLLEERNYKGRISKTLIANIIKDEKYILNKNSVNIPLTMKTLKEKTETVQSFQSRRIHRTIKNLKANNESIKTWLVMKQAGIKHQLYLFAEEEIEKALKNRIPK